MPPGGALTMSRNKLNKTAKTFYRSFDLCQSFLKKNNNHIKKVNWSVYICFGMY